MSYDDHDRCRRCGALDDGHSLASCDQRNATKRVPTPPDIPTPADLLREPVVDYTNRITTRVMEVVDALRSSPRKPVTIREDVPVIQAIADAMRAAQWSAHTLLHRDGKTGRVTISVPKPVDPALYR